MAPERFDIFRSPAARLHFGRGEKRMMGKCGRACPQRMKEIDLHTGIGHVILAADDVRDGKVDVIDDACKSVEECAVLADQHRIGKRAEIDRLMAADQIVPGDVRRLGRQVGCVLGVGQPEAPMRRAAFRVKTGKVIGR
jgi:hypothetical protein